MAWNMDLDVEVESLCTLRVKEIHEKLEQWNNYFKEEKKSPNQI